MSWGKFIASLDQSEDAGEAGLERGVTIEHRAGITVGSQSEASNAGIVSNQNIYSLDAARTLRSAFLSSSVPGPDGDTLDAWRDWMRFRMKTWLDYGKDRVTALGIVWGEAENQWHKRHGAEPNPDRCAGCGQWLLDEPGMALPDGARVHTGLDCLTLYGEEWRTAATVGLIELGLRRPPGLDRN